MFNISSDIAMAKMFSYSSSKYALPHWGYNRASLSQCNWNFQLFLFSLSCCIFILISSSLFCSFLFNLLLLIGVSLVLIFSINQSSSTTLISFWFFNNHRDLLYEDLRGYFGITISFFSLYKPIIYTYLSSKYWIQLYQWS